MPTTLTISDKTAAGHMTGETVVEFLTESVTIRELIRARVYQEVDDHNRRGTETSEFRGLVRPVDAERSLNGPPKPRQPIDWKRQFEVACDAFSRNGFFVLVDDKQADELDEVIKLRPGTQVSFVKLTQLVGG